MSRCTILISDTGLDKPDGGFILFGVLDRCPHASSPDILLADICGLLPPSTGLLVQLLEIPIMANVVNEFLARTTLDYIPDDISSNFTNLMNKGLDCENQLKQIFGPLPGNNQ
jgi:hypothetical protein